jgi:hypothetical protein
MLLIHKFVSQSPTMSMLMKPPRCKSLKAKAVSTSLHQSQNSAAIIHQRTAGEQKVMLCNTTSKTSVNDEMVELMKAKQQAYKEG